MELLIRAYFISPASKLRAWLAEWRRAFFIRLPFEARPEQTFYLFTNTVCITIIYNNNLTLDRLKYIFNADKAVSSVLSLVHGRLFGRWEPTYWSQHTSWDEGDQNLIKRIQEEAYWSWDEEIQNLIHGFKKRITEAERDRTQTLYTLEVKIDLSESYPFYAACNPTLTQHHHQVSVMIRICMLVPVRVRLC